ncbi:MAG: DUF1553 domain-containing protein [Planctomycetes bacterium]|nr:DUF1553 domain-containing protein [Planctomycetota bacterium]MCH9778011.1 DUF1553 domain-containing protein [Planctomycetota bacterium]MDF1745608.1 DUF1553 domain-containing protein [Gimesia sp.]
MLCRRILLCLAFFSTLSVNICLAEKTEPKKSGSKSKIDFSRDIRPILSDNCFHCHGPDTKHREGDLRLDIEAGAKASSISPGHSEKSELYTRISSTDPDLQMPPADSNKKLTPAQVELFKRWIDEGAEWTSHWSFITPKKSALPAVKNSKWVRNPIDQFVLAQIEHQQGKPSEAANRRTLIRRLSLDLTGLPPSIAEVNAFLNDSSPDAYEKVVDRLLTSKHYGERMALMWLDAARYGDTSVYHADGPRDMWAWRDRIVQMYNENIPFDQFSKEQLAGDLIPNATPLQMVSSGFNRNNGTTDEGGLIPEEYRVEYAVDRVKTTSTVWLGLSMECAQCHEHKYDPISHEDYYRFFGFFNISADAGSQTRKGNAKPIVELVDPEKQKKLPATRSRIKDNQKLITARQKSVGSAYTAWLKTKETQQQASPTHVEGQLLRFVLNRGEGKQVVDQVDTNRIGTIHGNANWVKSPHDQAVKFDGKTYIDLGAVCDFERTDSFSYGGWLNLDPKGSGALLAKMDDANSFRGYDILISGEKISVHIINKWPTNAIKVTTKKKLKPSTWQHVFVTYDGSSKAKGVKIYVDGQLWDWKVEQDRLTKSIRTPKTLLIGSRHPSSRLSGAVDEVAVFDRALSQSEVVALSKQHSITTLLAVAPEKRTPEQQQQLRQYYLEHEDKEYIALLKKKQELKAEETALLKPLTSVMVMGDMAKPRDTFILARGAYDAPTKQKVQPGTPAVLPPMSKDAAQNRLGLAQWLFQNDHPLTARVAINRYWQMLFGTGLVTTPEDFGSQGAFPSHPQLLDWLAVDFRESGWDVKRMLKQIVMSATYRQSSDASRETYLQDPANRLLARGARFRLQGEFVRDSSLAISGLLNNKMGGPGVKPYQPPGLWKEVGLSGKPDFVQDQGEKLYRRSLYTYWKRSAPPPNMQIFDAPTREKCTIRRPRTNTPLQALVTMNDVQFVEAARHLANRILKEGGTSNEAKISHACLLAMAREPRVSERKVLLNVYLESLKHYQANPKAAEELMKVGESPRDEKLNVIQQAAWTVVANTILNLDETLTRE